MKDKQPKTIREYLNDLKKIGPIRKRPPHVVQSLFYAVGQEEFEIAKEGYFALMSLYQVTSDDMRIINEALMYMFYHMLGNLHGKHELLDQELASKVIWH